MQVDFNPAGRLQFVSDAELTLSGLAVLNSPQWSARKKCCQNVAKISVSNCETQFGSYASSHYVGFEPLQLVALQLMCGVNTQLTGRVEIIMAGRRLKPC
jgi:hypothetical protein